MVDGIEPVSASMLSTVDLELSTSGLTWKNVTKGYRSKTRRSKKMVNNRSLSAGVKIDNKIPKSEQDSSVLESEKFGVAVLGRRFANQVENVPIRKRRFLIRAPSPPPTYVESLSAQPQTPPQSEEPEQILFCKLGSNDCSSPISYSNPVVTNGELGYFEDMSGIELLVAAACGTIGSPDNVKECSEVEEFVAVAEISSLSEPLKEITAVSVEEMQEPVKDGKFNWDLNVVMESDEPDDIFVSKERQSEVVIDSKSSDVFTSKDPSSVISTFAGIGEDCSGNSIVPLDESSVKFVQIVDNGVASHQKIAQGTDVFESDIIQSKDDDDLGSTHIFGNSSGNLDKVDNIVPSPNDDEFSASSTTIVHVQPIAISFVGGHDDKASADTAISDIPVHTKPEELIPKCDEYLGGGNMSRGLCKVYHENPTNSVCIVSAEEGSDVGGVESVRDYQLGYESPFEDGELRDSTNYLWDANEVDEGENECVDFVTGNGIDFDDTVDYPLPGNFGVGCDGGQVNGSGSSVAGNKDNEVEIGIFEKKMVSTGQIVKEENLKEQESSSAFKSSQEDRLQKRSPYRSDKHGGDPYHQPERKFGSYSSTRREKYFQVQSRNEAGGQWFDSSTICYGETRSRYANNYHVNGRGCSSPRGLVTDSVTKDYNLNYDERKPINYSTKSMYRPFFRRRSPPPPLHRDDRFPISRGRSGIFHDDSAAAPLRMPHLLSNRERDFSPNFSGAKFSQPHRKPRSRSRTRSPIFWNFQRDQKNIGTRQQHNPDFRSESKIESGSLPFQKPRFIDYKDRSVFPSRGRSPPQRNNTRWCDDRKGMDDEFRGRRSPPPLTSRMVRQPQRHFDSNRSYSSRHMVREAKSPPMAAMGIRRRKHDEGYEPINRVKRYDESGYMRRFRYDGEYKSGGFRGTISKKDVPMSFGEERSPRYNNDRVYANAPLVHEPLNYEEDASAAASSLTRGDDL